MVPIKVKPKAKSNQASKKSKAYAFLIFDSNLTGDSEAFDTSLISSKSEVSSNLKPTVSKKRLR